MAGHVYLIGSRVFRWYKIGKSSDAAIRISALGILLPFKIEVIAVWKAENHHELERLLHEKYADSKINGEWFRFKPHTVTSLIQEMAVAETKFNSNFTNMQKDVRIKAEYGGKVSRKIDRLIKENFQLKEQIKELSSGSTIIQ